MSDKSSTLLTVCRRYRSLHEEWARGEVGGIVVGRIKLPTSAYLYDLTLAAKTEKTMRHMIDESSESTLR